MIGELKQCCYRLRSSLCLEKKLKAHHFKQVAFKSSPKVNSCSQYLHFLKKRSRIYATTIEGFCKIPSWVIGLVSAPDCWHWRALPWWVRGCPWLCSTRFATLPCDSRRYRSSRESSCSQTATSSGAGGYPAPRKPTPTQVEGSAVHSSAGQSVMETFHDSKFNQGGRTGG